MVYKKTYKTRNRRYKKR